MFKNGILKDIVQIIFTSYVDLPKENKKNGQELI